MSKWKSYEDKIIAPFVVILWLCSIFGSIAAAEQWPIVWGLTCSLIFGPWVGALIFALNGGLD